MKSLYEEIRDAGIPLSNHASDLYFRATPEALVILARHPLQKSNATFFTNEAPPHKGERWVDVPFAYDPFWSSRQ